MGVCPTPARHIARPTTRIGWSCCRLPRAGLGATQTTTDPVRDWRREVSSRFLGVGLLGFGLRSCTAGKGHDSWRHEPALMHYISREQALDRDLWFHHESCRSKSSGPRGSECTTAGVIKTSTEPTEYRRSHVDAPTRGARTGRSCTSTIRAHKALEPATKAAASSASAPVAAKTVVNLPCRSGWTCGGGTLRYPYNRNSQKASQRNTPPHQHCPPKGERGEQQISGGDCTKVHCSCHMAEGEDNLTGLRIPGCVGEREHIGRADLICLCCR